MRGIQDVVYEIVKESKEKGLSYITKKQIITEMQQKGIKLENFQTQVGQALYHLQQRKKFRRPKIRQVYDQEKEIFVGYTVYKEKPRL